MYVSDPAQLNIQHLQQVGLFQGLTATELWAIYRAGRLIQVAQGTYIFHQGDPANVLYVLSMGQVKMTQVGAEGHQVLVRIVNSSEDFGSVAVFSNIPYPLSAQASENCVLLTWEKDVITRLMSTYPRMALNALRLLAERFKDLQDRYRELATERVERRVARTLLRLVQQLGRGEEGEVVLALSRQDLAQMTGTTLFTVSRILSQWEQRGLVETGREKVMIRQPQGLTMVAEDLP